MGVVCIPAPTGGLLTVNNPHMVCFADLLSTWIPHPSAVDSFVCLLFRSWATTSALSPTPPTSTCGVCSAVSIWATLDEGRAWAACLQGNRPKLRLILRHGLLLLAHVQGHDHCNAPANAATCSQFMLLFICVLRCWSTALFTGRWLAPSHCLVPCASRRVHCCEPAPAPRPHRLEAVEPSP